MPDNPKIYEKQKKDIAMAIGAAYIQDMPTGSGEHEREANG